MAPRQVQQLRLVGGCLRPRREPPQHLPRLRGPGGPVSRAGRGGTRTGRPPRRVRRPAARGRRAQVPDVPANRPLERHVVLGAVGRGRDRQAGGQGAGGEPAHRDRPGDRGRRRHRRPWPSASLQPWDAGESRAIRLTAGGSGSEVWTMQREVRKTVSVVFSDVAGSTALAEQLDPESLRRAMTRYFEVARRVHERHGGVVEKFIGDAVMAVFGIPHAHEDDALRAVRAAWELRRAMAALNRELERELEVVLPVRTGVNTGLVLAGDEQAGHAFVGGDTVNVAARLERAAGAGEVLLGEATYRLVADAVRVEPVAPFVPRGKTAPVAAFRLLEVAWGAAGLARRLDAPLVGRTGELDALDRLLDRAAGGPACELVTIFGDAGVGKSRLLQAFAERARERALVLSGGCPPYGEAVAAEVVGQLVAQAGRAGDGARPLGLAVDMTDPRSMFRGVRLLLETLARARPVVVLLDDVHRAEQVLLDLVEYLHAFAGARLLLVVAARRELPGRWPGWNVRAAGTVLDLEPLVCSGKTGFPPARRGRSPHGRRASLCSSNSYSATWPLGGARTRTRSTR